MELVNTHSSEFEQEFRERLTRLETRMDGMDGLHKRLGMVETSLIRMESSMTQLANDIRGVLSQQNDLMKQRGEWEKEKHEAELQALKDQTMINVIKNKWAPVVAFIGSVAMVVTVAGALFVWWLKTYFPGVLQ